MRARRPEPSNILEAFGCRILGSLGEIDGALWNQFAGDHPALRHEFLLTLQETGCAAELSGWRPMHLALSEDGRDVGYLPLYLKSHSYGEYVFDWAWADAYERHGLHYYPKLLSAVPFTPVSGPRLLAHTPERRRRLIDAARALTHALGVSSFHCLLPDEDQARELEQAGLMLRSQVQFHWSNRGYADFEDFLAAMNHEKRKKIRQERRRIREAGIEFVQLDGHSATEADWRFFVQCYNHTYRMHHSTPYLNLDFFRRLGQRMPQAVLLVIARRGGVPLGAAFDLVGPRTLYGRYWGSLEYVPGLHFEACYYQAIEFCIARGLETFEGGAQGEHKLARGLTPCRTWSAHHLEHPQFASAVAEFLARESAGLEEYIDELAASAPFKTPQGQVPPT